MKWFNIAERPDELRAFNFYIGGRGIGKTYSAIDYLVTRGEPFMYLRNSAVQLEECSTAFGNPFKRWGLDHGRDIRIITERKHSNIIEFVDEEPKLIGYAANLSSFENQRGVDLSDVKAVLFDEFIEMRSLPFDQFKAFANLYETVNRNRDIMGEEPLRVYLLSNAQKLDNAILAGYGVIPIIEEMLRTGEQTYTADNLHVELPFSEISEAKKQTANYQLTAGSDFFAEAISNAFANDSFAGIGKRPVNEFTPVCAIDGLFVYKHKTDGSYYICRTFSNKCRRYKSKDEMLAFERGYGVALRLADLDNKLTYSDFTAKSTIHGLLY